MASPYIGEPDVLTRLPRPASLGGRSWHSVVRGLSNGVNRKRQEICSAVDGDSVNIYEVRRGRNLCSFSVPPDSKFQCSPASFRIKSETGTPQRKIYCVIERRSQAILELFQDNNDDEKSKKSPRRISLGETESITSEIVFLESFNVVGLFRQNGHYEFFTPDLGSKVSAGRLQCTIDNARFIRVTVLSAADASTSILKSRPDIVVSASAGTVFACGVVASRSGVDEALQSLNYCVWTLDKTSAGIIETKLVLQHQLSVTIQLNLRDQDGVSFVSKSNKLILRTPSKFVKYDVSSIVPRQLLEFTLPGPDHISNVEVADNLILCANSGTIQLYNSTFRSLQASLDLAKGSLKRKRGNSASGPVAFVAYFPSLRRAIGTRRNTLVAVDLISDSTSASSANLQQNSLLLNNIGRGIVGAGRQKFSSQSRNTSLGTILAHTEVTEDWTRLVKELDVSVSQGDTSAFETGFLQHVQDDSVTESVTTSDFKISYVLSKIFILDPSASESLVGSIEPLHLQLRCPKLIPWLIERGYMSPSKLSEVLLPATSASNDSPISFTNIAGALITADPNLALLQQYISLSPRLDTEDLCQAARLLISIALGDAEGDEKPELSEVQQSIQYRSLVRHLQHRPDINKSLLDLLLCSTLVRLAKLHRQDVSKMLRTTFQGRDLFALIQFLRQKLFHQGHTRSFFNLGNLDEISANPDDVSKYFAHSEQHTDLSLSAIIAVMSSCIDAVGSLGLLGLNAEDNITEQLIPELSSEIERTTVAIEEAIFLQGIVRETLRYSESMLGKRQGRNGPDNTEGQVQKPGTIRTLHGATASEQIGSTVAALPIDLQANAGVDQYKIRKGNGKATERSRREMGMLQDRLRGPYTLERLVL